MTNQGNTWIVIPAYNEARRIGAVLAVLSQCVDGRIVVVDDASRDDTYKVLCESDVYGLHHKVNLGQGAALQTGITFALSRGAQYVVTFDADGQHDPTDIPKLLAALEEQQADFALGSRFLGSTVGMPWLRRLVLKAAVIFTRMQCGAVLTDAHNGIRAMTRRGATHLHITMNRMEHASQVIEQIVVSGLKYVEVPVTIHYTADTLAKGQSSTAAIRMGTRLLLRRLLG